MSEDTVHNLESTELKRPVQYTWDPEVDTMRAGVENPVAAAEVSAVVEEAYDLRPLYRVTTNVVVSKDENERRTDLCM